MAQIINVNLGCGFNKIESDSVVNWVNVDGFPICEPDVLWNLNITPLPFEDHSVDHILASHVFEHLENWWECFTDCARILKRGGTVEIRVPHISSDAATVYRDHVAIIDECSFDGIEKGMSRTQNAWFETQDRVPFIMVSQQLVAFPRYQKLPDFILKFCATHLRNFIHEIRFTFRRL